MSYSPVNLAGAIFNLSCSNPRYGRVKFIVEYFGIKRSTLHRKMIEFKDLACRDPGRPCGTSKTTYVKELERENEGLRQENNHLKNTLREKDDEHVRGIRKITFLLISIGLSGRVIAWILKSAFEVQVSHTTILKKAQEYAEKATLIMREHFHQLGINVAIDEVFLAGMPVFLAVSPVSLLICNVGIYAKRTEENWTEFLNMMKNLRGTVSDRGLAILAAIAKRALHDHQSDVFHCMYTVMKQLLKIERRCYSLITSEEEAEGKLGKRKKSGRDARKAAGLLRVVKKECAEAIVLYDSLAQAVDMAFSAMSISNGCTLNEKKDARETLDFVCEWINHIHPAWKKVVSAFRDPYLLEHIENAHAAMSQIDVECESPLDREYVLATLTHYWEEQASRRWRGKEVVIPDIVEEDLNSTCQNLGQVHKELFEALEGITKASSAVECVNSRFGFFRYSKKYFNNDFANYISVIHNLTPFLDGKRKGFSPAELEGMALANSSLFEIFGIE